MNENHSSLYADTVVFYPGFLGDRPVLQPYAITRLV